MTWKIYNSNNDLLFTFYQFKSFDSPSVGGKPPLVLSISKQTFDISMLIILNHSCFQVEVGCMPL